MKTSKHLTLVAGRLPIWLLTALVTSALSAQPVAPGSAGAGKDGVVTLSPFNVSSERNTGFVAASSLAGGRLAGDLKDTPVGYSVASTDQFGTSRLNNLPSGPVELEFYYTGLDTKRATVLARSGDVSEQDIVLTSAARYPISSLMTHGIVINRSGREKTSTGFDEGDMLDAIRSFFASGVNAQELYMEPEVMTPRTWDALAEAATWFRANTGVLADTHWIGGDPGEAQIYGWAAWSKQTGILSLRNTSDQPTEITVDIADALELPDGGVRTYVLKSPWKTGASIVPLRLSEGRKHTFLLRPFEVLVLDAMPE